MSSARSKFHQEKAYAPKRMVGYGRVSTDREEQKTSIANQKRYFESYAKQRGYVLVKIYFDEGITGTSLKKRIDFNQMISASAHDMFDIVAVKDVKRFARNVVDGIASVRELRKNGVETEFTLNNMNGELDNEAFLAMSFSYAQKESTDLSKSVAFGKEINAEKGRVPLRVFGYDRVDNFTLVPNDVEAEAVRNMFDWYVNHGMGLGTIATKLNELGIPTKLSGKMWYPRTVRRMMQNKLYIGILINHKSKTVDVLEHERAMRPEHEWKVHDRPQFRIVDDKIFYQAQDKLERNQQIYKNKYTHILGRESSRHLFSTLIKCEHCSRSYEKRAYDRKNDRREFYKCAGLNTHGRKFCDNNETVEEKDLLDFVLNYLRGLVQEDKKFIERAVKQAEKVYKEKMSSTDTQKLKSRQEKLERHCRKNKELYLNDMLSIEEYKTEIARLNGEIEVIKSELSDIHQETIKQEKNALIAELQKKSIDGFLNENTITNADLKKVIDFIRIGKSGVHVHLINNYSSLD
ncbi:MAG: recombinase family protein [Oscillospiraceae bacterium]|nr:recombinase family protein [Oscillospiraceae bacterium]